jgi:non-heme chloroperoxidase
LAVHEYGLPTGRPIVLIHGINQCALVWHKQYGSAMAKEFRFVCPDLRGHGMSDKPTDPEYYNQSALWADDVQAVLTALSLRKPVLVGWSYGGYVLNDYLARFGQDAIGGLDYVCAGVVMGGPNTTQMLGREFINTISGLCSDNLEDNIQAVRQLIRVLFERQPSQEEVERQVAYSMVVPPTARLGMFSRTIDCDAMMERLTIPVLVTSGDKDSVVTLAHTEHLLAVIPHAKPSVFEGVGHCPHLEDAERFNRELSQFARQYTG